MKNKTEPCEDSDYCIYKNTPQCKDCFYFELERELCQVEEDSEVVNPNSNVCNCYKKR
jgi:hypothetical protein